MMAAKAPTFKKVAGWPDRAFGCLPVTEVPTTQVLRGPVQGTQVMTSSKVVTLHVLPVLADASGSLQSGDVLTPAVQPLPNVE